MITQNLYSREECAVSFVNVTKKFDKIKANDGVNFQIKKGEIHAIIGENGAGKSTAMNILFGMYKIDFGRIEVNNKPYSPNSPRDAIKYGVGMVHQHFMLAESETVLDNIILGEEQYSLKLPFIPKIFNIIDRKSAFNEVQKICENYGINIPLEEKIKNISVANQQKVEIIKILYRKASLLILDEPTAVLNLLEINSLFESLLKLKGEGKTIIIVTHKLKEVLNYSDSLTIFRSGKVVGQMPTLMADEGIISSLMIGKSFNLKQEIFLENANKEIIFDFQNLNSKIKLKLNKNNDFKNILMNSRQFYLKKGEILGIAGVDGNGQGELIKLIYTMTKNIKNLHVSYIPEDRHRDALLLNMPVYENYILGRHKEKKFCYFTLFHRIRRIKKYIKNEMKNYDIRPKNTTIFLSKFSGGNQQKLVIAREFGRHPNFVIAVNPTRGVDIGAIDTIHKKIISERNNGVGFLLVSSELDEILALSDRIVVMFNKQFIAEFKRGEVNEHLLGLAICGSVGENE